MHASVLTTSDFQLKTEILVTADVMNTAVWTLTLRIQELEYRIHVCRVTRGTHIEHL
jgi:hypothetical protein